MALSQVHLLEVDPSQMHLVSVAEVFTLAFPGTGVDGTKLLWLFPHGRFKQNRKVGSEDLRGTLSWKLCTKPLAMLVGGLSMFEKSRAWVR